MIKLPRGIRVRLARNFPIFRYIDFKKFFIFGLIFKAATLVLPFVVVPMIIDAGVRHNIKQVAQHSDHDPVQAIIDYVRSDQHSWYEKKHMVWTLGEIGDTRALPVLENLLAQNSVDPVNASGERLVMRSISKINGAKPSILNW